MIIDISQEVFSCKVYPGDPSPEMERLLSTDNGDVCNLTAFSMCAHNGTHIDAPFHFYGEGKTVDRMGLEPFVGDCYVARHSGEVTDEDAAGILARAVRAGDPRRIHRRISCHCRSGRYLQMRSFCLEMRARNG